MPTRLRAVETACPPFRTAWNGEMVDGVARFWVRQGDTGRPIVVLLKDADGGDAVMPAGTACAFRMVHQQTGHVVSGAATLSDGPSAGSNNRVTYPLSDPADTARPGVYDASWSVSYPGAATAVAAGSDGVHLPAGVVQVTDTSGFPPAGTFTVSGTTGTVRYSGTTATSFTGCTGGAGVLASGQAVTAPPLSETFPTRPSRGQTGYAVEVVPAPGDLGLSG